MYDRILLFPYTLTLALRNAMYDRGFLVKSVEADVPTICVGNVTVGGTGKTPHTEMLLNLLQDHGVWGSKNIAVLSRGYKRSGSGFQQVTPDCSADFVGDEPLQIKKKFPAVTVAVDKDRVRGCDMLAHPEKLQTLKSVRKCRNKDLPPAGLILLDDAFQYRKLKASVNIVLIDYNRPTYEDHLMPLGKLRDLPSRVRKSDIIIVTKCPKYMDDWEKQDWAKNLGIKNFNIDDCSGEVKGGRKIHLFFTFLSYCHPEPIYDECDTRYAYSKRVVLFTGIAKDTPLRQYLSDNYKIVDRFNFPDHHKFSRADIRAIANSSAKWSTAAVVTTEKDAQRVLDYKKLPSELKERLFQVPVKVVFSTEREDAIFRETLSALLSGNPF